MEGRQGGLDGVRGVAITLVVVAHTLALAYPSGGGVGVSVFFTLSGFLIATLLLAERDRTGTINVAAFYSRRARRLLPALVVFLAVMLTTGMTTWRDTVPPLFYVQNFHRIYGGYSGPLGHLWSLSVEEQFYAVMPVALLLAVRHMTDRAVLRVVLAAAWLSAMWRVWLTLQGEWVHAYYGTETSAYALLGGVALAIIMRSTDARPPGWTAAVAVVGLGVLGSMAMSPTGPVLLAVPFTAVMIAASSRARWLSWGPLTLLGRRSYGLYLWHWPALSVVWPLLDRSLVGLVVCLAGSWLLTAASWRWVESPWLARGSRRAGLPVSLPTHA